MKYDVRSLAVNCSVDFHSTTQEFSINDVLFKSQISPIQEGAHPPVCSLHISHFYFRVHIGERLCSSPSLLLLPLSIVLTSGPLAEGLAAYFYAPTDQHTDNDTGWNLFYPLGGNGPWIPKVEGVIHGTLAPPTGCDVDQVHMVMPFPNLCTCPNNPRVSTRKSYCSIINANNWQLSRHAERYPTQNAGARGFCQSFETVPCSADSKLKVTSSSSIASRMLPSHFLVPWNLSIPGPTLQIPRHLNSKISPPPDLMLA